MDPKRSITLTSQLRQSVVLSLVIVVLALPLQVLAHGGMEHVLGTVVKVSDKVLTVKTAKGNIDVTLNDKTEITHDKHPAQVADLKAGTRVAVEAMKDKDGKTLIAHTVKIGIADNAKAGHEGHQ